MRLICFTISAGLCVVPLCAWGLVSLCGDSALQTAASHQVERATTGDRTQHPFNVGMPAFSVEIAGQSDSTITVRDRDGSLLYRVDPANRTTIVAKRENRTRPIAVTLQDATSQQPIISLPLPDGCESAFSPYAAPNKAHVIGRCIS
jgi:hypothetical protein